MSMWCVARAIYTSGGTLLARLGTPLRRHQPQSLSLYCSKTSLAQVRAAGCVWLVALASYTGRQRALLARLGDLQEAFTALLGDASETAQEMASRGLSVVYQLGDAAGREQLLGSLMGTLQGAALHATVVQDVRQAGMCRLMLIAPMAGSGVIVINCMAVACSKVPSASGRSNMWCMHPTVRRSQRCWALCSYWRLQPVAGGPRKRRAVKLTGESRVFEDGALGEAPGGGRCANLIDVPLGTHHHPKAALHSDSHTTFPLWGL